MVISPAMKDGLIHFNIVTVFLITEKVTAKIGLLMADHNAFGL